VSLRHLRASPPDLRQSCVRRNALVNAKVEISRPATRRATDVDAVGEQGCGYAAGSLSGQSDLTNACPLLD
jgi:hypothetical protein